ALKLVAAIPLIAVLLTLVVWIFYLYPLAAIRGTARVDRLEVFSHLSAPVDSSWRLPGLVAGGRVSIGLYLAVLLALAYLSEKYFMAWPRVRWPVPLVPVAMAASLVWVIATGERAQREFVAVREWRAVAPAQAFPQALEACTAVGPGWTLPRPSELKL